MSSSILTLVEQRYKKKAQQEWKLMLNQLHKEVENVPVRFRWLSNKTKESHLLEGHVVGVSWLPGREMSFAIRFECPDTGALRTCPRESSELQM